MPSNSPKQPRWRRRVALSLLILFVAVCLTVYVTVDPGESARTTGDDTPPLNTGKTGKEPPVSHSADSIENVDNEPRMTPDALVSAVITPKIRERMAKQRRGLSPQNDGWETETFVEEAKSLLKRLLKQLVHLEDVSDGELNEMVSPGFVCGPLRPIRLIDAFRDETLLVRRAEPLSLQTAPATHRGTAGLLDALRALGRPLRFADTLQLEIKISGVSARQHQGATKALVEIRCASDGQARQLNTTWDCLWERRADGSSRLSAIRVRDFEEVVTLGRHRPWFSDCTQSVLGHNPSLRRQLVYGLDHWLKRIERAHRIHVFAASGLAVGDVNGDLLDDLYVCQPGGLPNRLFVQNADGTATDQSQAAGVDWLEASSSALLVDLDNDGDQDLVVATLAGLLVMENDSTGTFALQTKLPTGGADMQSLSAADYDLDGNLDLYVCLNFPKATSESPDAPSRFVYHDANDGAANRLFRNAIMEGSPWRFTDVTRATGLDVNNRRHSLAAAWEDYDNDGDPDLYVANDYGRNCLYRNDAGQFVDVAEEAGVVDFGSGMSVSWADFDRDGQMDLYVGNMFSSAGSRITPQSAFRPGADETTRRILRRFAKGNSLYKNMGDGTFREVGSESAVEIGRWAWSSIFLDINNNGWEDLFVANGYITTEDTGDL